MVRASSRAVPWAAPRSTTRSTSPSANASRAGTRPGREDEVGGYSRPRPPSEQLRPPASGHEANARLGQGQLGGDIGHNQVTGKSKFKTAPQGVPGYGRDHGHLQASDRIEGGPH